jgi:phthalate 4,5-dioxygenase
MLSKEKNEKVCRVGRGTPMGEVFRRYWLPVVVQEELPAPDCDPVRVRILGEDLVAFRDSAGAVGLIDAYCPHRLAPLYYGRNEEGGLRCIYHGLKFDVTGACVDYPCMPPGSRFQEKTTTTAYPTCEAGGLVWAYLGPPELQPPPPDVPFTAFAANELARLRYLVECNWLQTLEGDFDMEHVAYLHRSISAESPNAYVQDTITADGLDPFGEYTVIETEFGLSSGTRWQAGDGMYTWRVNQLLLPSFMQIPFPGAHMGETSLIVPIDDTHCLVFIIWHTDRMPMIPGPDGKEVKLESLVPLERSSYELDDGVIIDVPVPLVGKRNNYGVDRQLQRSANYTGMSNPKTEDIAVTEGMGRIVDRSREHLNPTDKPIVALRRRLLAVIEDLERGIEPPHVPLTQVRPVDISTDIADLDAVLRAHGAAASSTV